MGNPLNFVDEAGVTLVFANDMTITQDLRASFVCMIAHVGNWLRDRFPPHARLVYSAFGHTQPSLWRQRITFLVTDVTREMAARRALCKDATLAFLHCKPLYVRDLMQLIVRYIWLAREDEIWPAPVTIPKKGRDLSWTM
jgi:hypothetical protein